MLFTDFLVFLVRRFPLLDVGFPLLGRRFSWRVLGLRLLGMGLMYCNYFIFLIIIGPAIF